MLRRPRATAGPERRPAYKSPMTTRADCLRLDADDPLASLRDLFELPAGVIYLDGNSLGALPRAAPARLREVACDEWGRGLIRSWNTGWMGLAQRVGDKIARLVGAGPGELVVTEARPELASRVVTYAAMRERLASATRPTLILFGTAHGLHPDVIDRADVVIEPIEGAADYNHLSVRAAAAITFDRLFGRR